MRILTTLLATLLLAGTTSSIEAFPIPTLKFGEPRYPTIDVETDPIPPATLEDTWLNDGDGTKAPAVRVERARAPLAIAFVVCSDRSWLRAGIVDSDRRTLGGLAIAEGMLREVSALVGTTETKVVLVTYDHEAHVVAPPVDLQHFLNQPLGVGENFNRDGRDLAGGISLGLEQLATIATPRKLLVVLGDGNASDEADTRAALVGLEERARDEGVEVAAITYPLNFEGDRPRKRSIMTSIFTTPREVSSVSDAVEAMRAILAQSRDRYRIQIDGSSLAWAGRLHILTLAAGEVHIAHHSILLPVHATPGRLSSWRWALVAIAVGVFTTLLLVVRRWRR